MEKTCISLFTLVFIMVAASQAMAHNVWLNPSNHFPKMGDTVDLEIAWGHTYKENRVDQKMKEGNVAFISVLDPDGQKVTPVTVDETHFQVPIQKKGAYLVTAGIKPGVFTKTAQGRKWCDKRGVDQAISCTSYAIEAKTVILAGDSTLNGDRVTGRDLEIIPMGDLLTLKPGQALPIKVLFKGKPAAGVNVNATFAGFSPDKKDRDIAPHNPKEKKKNRFPVSVVTDKDGNAKISFERAGYWMALISHKTPYPDTTVCDEYMNNVALTFQVK